MKEKSPIQRRDFFRISSAAVVAGVTGKLAAGQQTGLSAVEEAAEKVGKLPRRKLGYSGREVSVILGAADLAPACREAGILCGMNYWHKANRWMRDGAPESILKNREAHYCQVNVDRAGPDHYRGHFDEDQHVAFVREAVEKTGLGYFDDMQLHYGYHSVEELKTDRSFIRAFDRLKKQGLVKHLCLSQHSYAGNSRVPGGQSAAEILTAVVEDGLYEHAQFIYSYGAEPELDEFMAFARKKGFGTIAMKTSRGIGRMKEDPAFMAKLPEGVSPHNTLVRWLTTGTLLDTAVIRVRDLNEFVETYSGAGKPVRPADSRAIALMTERADRTACRLCAKCQPHCPEQVPITEILRFERYALDDHDRYKANRLYAALDRQADRCVGCGTCVAHCPLNLRIPEKLAEIHRLLG